jgi:hypothetical protein
MNPFNPKTQPILHAAWIRKEKREAAAKQPAAAAKQPAGEKTSI